MKIRVHTFGFVAVIALATCCGRPKATVSTPPAASARISPAFILVDVRTPEEFRESQVAGAINVPLGELERKMPEVAGDKAAPVAVYCRSGRRSAQAKALLERMGYQHVQDLGPLTHAREVVEREDRKSARP